MKIINLTNREDCRQAVADVRKEGAAKAAPSYDVCSKCGRKMVTGPIIIRKGKLLCSEACWELVANLGEEPKKL